MSEYKEINKIKISPVALFEIIKNIKNGGNSESMGYLYGMWSDPIELTNAIPVYPALIPGSKREEFSKNDSDQTKFQKNCLKNLKSFNYDYSHVGFYTSKSYGGKPSFKDILELIYRIQKETPYFFGLFVDISSINLIVRAFRLSKEALNYLKNPQKGDLEFIPPCLTYENIIQELEIIFEPSPLESAILSEMLTKFKIISDVFTLTNLNSFETKLTELFEQLDTTTNNLQSFLEDYEITKQNKQKRELWIKERIEKNKIRQSKGDTLLSLDVDEEIPEKRLNDKNVPLHQLFNYRAKSDSLNNLFVDEKKKIEVLLSLQ